MPAEYANPLNFPLSMSRSQAKVYMGVSNNELADLINCGELTWKPLIPNVSGAKKLFRHQLDTVIASGFGMADGGESAHNAPSMPGGVSVPLTRNKSIAKIMAGPSRSGRQ